MDYGKSHLIARLCSFCIFLSLSSANLALSLQYLQFLYEKWLKNIVLQHQQLVFWEKGTKCVRGPQNNWERRKYYVRLQLRKNYSVFGSNN